MKKMLFVSLMAVLVPNTDSLAQNYPRVEECVHPGNTAPDGKHFCWTNCTKWGVVYGERHGYGWSSDTTFNILWLFLGIGIGATVVWC